MRKALTSEFFEREGKLVARDILGKYLVRKEGKEEEAYMIVEVELYDGLHDKASHAHKGETKRTKPMYGPPGHLYIYLIYGIYLLLNITVREAGYPSAILIRRIGGVNGPGRVGRALKLNINMSGQMANKTTGLWLEDRGIKVPKRSIKRSARIGVEYAGEVWSKRLLRYYIDK